MHSVNDQENVFYGATLKDAFRQVEGRYGKDVIILGSRKITRRQEKGLGQEHLIEVTVQPPGGPRARTAPRSRSAATVIPMMTKPRIGPDPESADAPADLLREIEREVERIEQLVQDATQEAAAAADQDDLEGNPLAETLKAAGTSPLAVKNLFTRFVGETGKMHSDRPAALAWLVDNLKASNCGWDGFFGCHAFLGNSGSGRTRMVLEAAAHLQKQGRKTLVLSVHPEHSGEIRRLQNAAAELGFDAAIIRKDSQLAMSEKHLGNYEAVLLDLPALGHASLAVGGAIHSWLGRNHSFHRHLVIPLDRDFQDLEELKAAARTWNCDWLALSRLDQTRLQGKILDLVESIPLPFSLWGETIGTRETLSIADSGALLDRILAAGSSAGEPTFVSGEIVQQELAE